MQSIITRRIQWTAKRPTRIKASCARGSITVTDDSPHEANHIAAANKLIEKFIKEDGGADKCGFAMPFVTGQLPNGDYVHVFITPNK